MTNNYTPKGNNKIITSCDNEGMMCEFCIYGELGECEVLDKAWTNTTTETMSYEDAFDILSNLAKKALYRDEKEAYEIALEAIEKQIPMKVEKLEKGFWGEKIDKPTCPICLSIVKRTDEYPIKRVITYCEYCGQAIDWSESEAAE